MRDRCYVAITLVISSEFQTMAILYPNAGGPNRAVRRSKLLSAVPRPGLPTTLSVTGSSLMERSMVAEMIAAYVEDSRSTRNFHYELPARAIIYTRPRANATGSRICTSGCFPWVTDGAVLLKILTLSSCASRGTRGRPRSKSRRRCLRRETVARCPPRRMAWRTSADSNAPTTMRWRSVTG